MTDDKTLETINQFLNKEWPLNSYPNAFVDHLASLKSKQIELKKLNIEQMKIDETISKVDSILDSIKDLKIDGNSKKNSKNSKITVGLKAKVRSENSVLKTPENDQSDITLPKFSLHPPKNADFNPLEILKKSVPSKTLKLYQMTKNLENNISLLSTNLMKNPNSEYNELMNILGRICVKDGSSDLELDQNLVESKRKVEKSLDRFIENKLNELCDKMDNGELNKDEGLREYRELMILVNYVEKGDARIPTIIRKPPDLE